MNSIFHEFSLASLKEKMIVSVLIIIKLNINWWLGNWSHQRLVGALLKYQAQQGGSMATLYKREPALQPTASHHCHTEETSEKKFSWPDTLHRFLWGVGRSGSRIGKIGNQTRWSTKLNWASKLQIWWPMQWSVQGSDPQRSAEQTTTNIATRAHT